MAAHGLIETAPDVQQLARLVERIMERSAIRRVLFDARGLEREVPPAACDEIWIWLSARLYVQMAVVLPEHLAELGLTRFNMTGLSAQLPLRAFPSVMEGHRWLEMRLSGERRLSQMGMTAVPAPDTRSASPPPTSVRAGPPANSDERVGKKRSGSFVTGEMESLLPDSGTDGGKPTR